MESAAHFGLVEIYALHTVVSTPLFALSDLGQNF